MSTSRYDYIVIGAGAAGCAVANRLSADPHTTVLLLEAGGRDWSPLIHMPVGFTKLSGPKVNWGFHTVPQRQLDNRRMYYPQGRTLGGSTSINAMIYIRGQREDYDRWAQNGNPDWSYANVLPFFKRAEHNERLNDEFHGSDGAMNVTEQIQHNPLSKAFVRAAQELGVTFIADFNGARQEGVSWYDVTQRNARRESASTAYLRPIRGRKNLTIQTHALATRVLVEKGRAVGLRYLHKGHPTTAYADREVILSGGAVNSPRLLLLSGIGPADELRALGIDVVHDLPGVGKNFQDHMDVYLTAETVPVSYNQSDRPDRALLAGLQYITTRTGPITASVCEAGMFVRSSADVATPDIQMHALPAYVIDHGRMRVKGHGMTINTCNLRPRSTGQVTLRSSDPADEPDIDPNFLDDPYDWKVSLEGFRWGREMLATKAFAPFVKREHMPGKDIRTDAQIREYVRRWAKTDYHPVGSCKMGADPLAVVDQALRVHGIEGLRVIDASIMPTLISGNTQATSIMIGEKGAHHVLGGAVADVDDQAVSA
ncbi:choline dehydrogenase [Actinoplanes sp. NBRC 101535]|uniref:GMC family oxidoreductase n=1 Tax=Actinoplanes sp. NBRC 101535 TaxID=3032196 RepID=UPI0024A056F4|nr:choline dehydrogenase [Actinoplanes sp. NBRC 101535]GLY02391.1 alanine-phosphoribitol ligase [Actinoplanes sp. NBRC 101535]